MTLISEVYADLKNVTVWESMHLRIEEAVATDRLGHRNKRWPRKEKGTKQGGWFLPLLSSGRVRLEGPRPVPLHHEEDLKSLS